MTSGSGLEARFEHAVPLHFRPQPLEREGREEDDAVGCARRSRLRWQVSCGLAFALAVTSFAIVIDASVYEARALVMIRSTEGGGDAPQALGSALQAEVEIVQSFEVLRQALEGIGVGVLYPDLEGETSGALRAAGVARMRSALAVRTQPDSSVIEVSFRHDEAQLAADVVNRLVERFQSSRRLVLAPVASVEFLRERTLEQRAALAAAEASLAAFHTEHPQVAGDARRALAERRTALEAELRSRSAALASAHRTPRAADPSVARAHARLDELELTLQETLNGHVEGSQAVSKLRSEIALVREHLAQKQHAAVREQERRLEQLRSREGEVEARLAALGEAERELPELERRARELARDRDAIARRLDAHQRALETATLSAALEKESIAIAARVLERAETPTAVMVPAEPARRAWALLGAALAVLLLAFGMDVLDRPRTAEQPALWAAEVPSAALRISAEEPPPALPDTGAERLAEHADEGAAPLA